MNKCIFFILMTISITVMSSSQVWTKKGLEKVVSDSTHIFTGLVSEATYTYEVNGKEISKQEAENFAENYFDKNQNSQNMPFVYIIIKARIKISKVLKGTHIENEIISYKWKDVYNAQCPHSTTSSAQTKKEVIWYSNKKHQAKKPSFSTMNKKHLATINTFITSKKQTK